MVANVVPLMVYGKAPAACLSILKIIGRHVGRRLLCGAPHLRVRQAALAQEQTDFVKEEADFVYGQEGLVIEQSDFGHEQ